MDQELHVWDRPEDVNYTRPTFVVSAAAPGADVMAQTAAALGAASAVFSKEDPVYAALLLIAAESLYSLAAANEGLYSDNFVPNAKVHFAGPTPSADMQVMSMQRAITAQWSTAQISLSTHSSVLCCLVDLHPWIWSNASYRLTDQVHSCLESGLNWNIYKQRNRHGYALWNVFTYAAI